MCGLTDATPYKKVMLDAEEDDSAVDGSDEDGWHHLSEGINFGVSRHVQAQDKGGAMMVPLWVTLLVGAVPTLALAVVVRKRSNVAPQGYVEVA